MGTSFCHGTRRGPCAQLQAQPHTKLEAQPHAHTRAKRHAKGRIWSCARPAPVSLLTPLAVPPLLSPPASVTGHRPQALQGQVKAPCCIARRLAPPAPWAR